MGTFWSTDETENNTFVKFVEDTLHGFIDNCCISEFVDINDKTVLHHPCCVVAVSKHYRQILHLNEHNAITIKLMKLWLNKVKRNINKQILKDFVHILFETATWPDRRLCKYNNIYIPIHYSSVVCGPQRLYISRIYIENDNEAMHNIIYLNPSGQINYGLTTMQLRHKELDKALMEELNDYKTYKEEYKEEKEENICIGTGMIMYSPMFYLLKKGVNDINELGVNDIIHELIKKDKLFGLSLFFGNCLIDRTDILNKTTSIKLTILNKIPFSNDYKAFNKSLSDIMLERAKMIFDLCSEKNIDFIDIYWSGGIDSTALLCALFIFCQENNNTLQLYKKLVIKISKQSLNEYQWFYDNILLSMNSKFGVELDEIIATKTITQQLNMNHLSITGELGDQLFGSSLLAKGFKSSLEENSYNYNIWINKKIKNRFLNNLHLHWTKTLIFALTDAGIIENNTNAINEWIKWIQPQLNQCPFPIISTYDILWWLNYSCKWQHVSLRLFHGLNGINKINETYFQNVIHFYQYQPFELWTLNPINHKEKFPDLSKWTTYKKPLKEFILNYTKDKKYYQNKEKIGSLCQVDQSGTHMLGIDDEFNIISYGKHSLSKLKKYQKYNNQIAEKLFY